MSELMEIGGLQIPKEDWESTPASVKLLVAELLQENQELRERVRQLEERLSQLEERLNQTSENSSRPPSKDKLGFKRAPKAKPSGRMRGGQPGHRGHQRELYAAEDCTRIEDVKPKACRHCGVTLSGSDPSPYRHQVVELPPVQPEVFEYRLHQLACAHCGQSTRASVPAGVTRSCYGERLVGLVGLLSGRHYQSHQLVQVLLRDLFGVSISVGGINRVRREVNAALAAPVAVAKAYVQQQRVLGSDETGFAQHNGDGHNSAAKRGWLWVLVTPLVSVFEVALSRSQAIAQQLIGETFAGIVTSDRYGAYNWLAVEQRQVCWAHLQRDFVAISQRSGASAEIGQALLKRQRRLFHWWQRVRDGTLSRALFVEAVQRLRQGVHRELTSAATLILGKAEKTPLAKTVRTCRQLLKVEAALWTFVEVDGVEPTNNAAERALRPAVIWRRLSYGSKSQAGSEFVGRILTVTTTLKAQHRSAWEFLTQACRAARHGTEPPSLLPDLVQIPIT